MNKNMPVGSVKAAYEDPKVVAKYRNRELLRAEGMLVKRFFPKGGHVLDIVCGTGRTSFPLNDMGYRVVGIDLSSGMIKAAAEEAEKRV